MLKSKLKKAAALSAALLLCLPGTSIVHARETHRIYVDAQKGSDENAGTKTSPYQSLEKAQEAVRLLGADLDSDVEVLLAGGIYRLEEPLVFTAEDGGSNGHAVTWKAEDPASAPVISGSQKIEGWSRQEGSEIWQAPAKGIQSRDLMINGEKAMLAGQDLHAYEYTKKYIYADDSNLPESFARMQDVEVIFAQKWKYCIQKITSYSDNDDYENCKRLKLTDAAYEAHKKNMTGAAIDAEAMAQGVRRIQNAYELLDEPGEFYLDVQEDTLYYMPRPEEEMESADAELGAVENMVILQGSAEAPVSDLHFSNLVFTGNTWNKPSEEDGLQTFQAAAVVKNNDDWDREWIPETSGAVYGTYTNRIGIDGCTFETIGNAAIHLGRGTKNALIKSNQFAKTGGAAILLGGTELADHLPVPADLCENCVIANNEIVQAAQTYRSNAGIQAGFVRNVQIDHNSLSDLPYTGISVGWGWGYNDFNANTYFRLGHNQITGNKIEEVLTEPWLIDGGGIYTLGRQDDSVMKDNVIYGVRNEFGGIYLDEGTVGYTVTNNVLQECVRNFLYKGDYNEIYDNYAAQAQQPDRDERLPIGESLVYRFENNDLWDEEAAAKLTEAAGVKKEGDARGNVMHRLYNPNSGEHFYTANAGEAEYLVKIGWKKEGIGWTAPAKSGVPVYRLYNPNAGDHHYTLDEAERDMLVQKGWNDEGIGWYSSETRDEPVYRLYNPNAKAGAHHYTTSLKEYVDLAKIGWKAENIAWYGME